MDRPKTLEDILILRFHEFGNTRKNALSPSGICPMGGPDTIPACKKHIGHMTIDHTIASLVSKTYLVPNLVLIGPKLWKIYS